MGYIQLSLLKFYLSARSPNSHQKDIRDKEGHYTTVINLKVISDKGQNDARGIYNERLKRVLANIDQEILAKAVST